MGKLNTKLVFELSTTTKKTSSQGLFGDTLATVFKGIPKIITILYIT